MQLKVLIDREAARLDAADLYYGHGTGNALDEACYLIAAVIGFAAVYKDFDPGKTLSPGDEAAVKTLVDDRIRTRKPAAYLVGRAWFAGLEFQVNESVLIPRSPIAELIEEQFVPWISPGTVRRILDIGTGSGCIAIACAYWFDDADVDAIDIDTAALSVAQRNVANHGLQERVHVIRSDLFKALESRRYDLIIANPPYVSRAEMDELPAEYQHEPTTALLSGGDGLLHAGVILAKAADHLTENGHLVLETGNTWRRLVEKYPQVPFLWFEFERGGEGVCMLSRDDLRNWFEPAKP